MATTLADAAAVVERRLNLAASGTTSTPPTTAHITDDLRDAFRYYFGILQPIFLTSTTLSSAGAATVTSAALIQHVILNRVPLFRHEYHQTASGLTVQGFNLGRASDTIYIYYTSKAEIASGATSVESTCIHGGDWLQSICILRAEMQALIRMGMTSDSGNATMRAQWYRVLERDRERMESELRATRDRDLGLLQQQLNDRAQWGKGAFGESGLAGFEVDVRTPNWTSGQP